MAEMGVVTARRRKRRRKGRRSRDDGAVRAIGSSERRCEGGVGRFLAMVAVLLVVSETSRVCSAQSLNEAKAYLDNVENEVMRLAAKASENFANTCDLVESCAGACSRQSCQPLQGDVDLLTCKNVALNPTCSDSNGKMGCSQLRVMLSRSFVRLPTTPDVGLTSADNYAICSQRMLDPLFLNVSSAHNSAINLTSWFYFGSVEGVQRSFPGRDVAQAKCTFEPRKRPWYMAATAVQKDLVVLLDGGNSMGDDIPGDIFINPLDFTKFNASVNMIKELLDTLVYGDRVSVVVFSSAAAATKVMSVIATRNATDMVPYKASLSSLSVDPSPGTSNLLAGLQLANATFSPSTPGVLKSIVLLTDGQFADATNLPGLSAALSSFRTQQTLASIYSFDRSSQAATALSAISCALNGTYERVHQTVMNPLWTMRSWFGVIARWRLAAVGSKPYWSKPYIDSGSLSEVITVAYPAFADDDGYTLVGVVGSDVLLTELGAIGGSSDFSAALGGRVSDQVYSVEFEALPCNIQLSNNSTCPSVSTSVLNPLCPSNDTSNLSFADRVCNCPPQCKAPSPDAAGSVSPAVIGAASAGAACAALALLAVVVFCCRRRRNARKVESIQVSGYASSVISSPKKGSTGKGGVGLRVCFGQGYSDDSESTLTGSAVFTSTSSGGTRRQKSNKAPAWPTGNKSLSRDVVSFTLQELEAATNNFATSTLLGRGACGSVFRGTLLGIPRAIKKPHDDVEVANSTFDKELDLLSKLNHKCLVRLIGYCDNHHILVFEFMAHGTLEDCLHKHRLHRSLTWSERLRIAAGAAKGLEYLHEYATTMIIHGDVKPANILLDEKLEAHISDFGLSLSTHDSDASMVWASRMGGTPGYFDPEYASLGSLTPKSDVYSFGIVLLELLSGRKVVQENQNISTWAADRYKDGDVVAVLDPRLDVPPELDCLQRVVELALDCVNREHHFRPKMKDVSAVLSAVASAWEVPGGDATRSASKAARRDADEIEEDGQCESSVQQLL